MNTLGECIEFYNDYKNDYRYKLVFKNSFIDPIDNELGSFNCTSIGLVLFSHISDIDKLITIKRYDYSNSKNKLEVYSGIIRKELRKEVLDHHGPRLISLMYSSNNFRSDILNITDEYTIKFLLKYKFLLHPKWVIVEPTNHWTSDSGITIRVPLVDTITKELNKGTSEVDIIMMVVSRLFYYGNIDLSTNRNKNFYAKYLSKLSAKSVSNNCNIISKMIKEGKLTPSVQPITKRDFSIINCASNYNITITNLKTAEKEIIKFIKKYYSHLITTKTKYINDKLFISIIEDISDYVRLNIRYSKALGTKSITDRPNTFTKLLHYSRFYHDNINRILSTEDDVINKHNGKIIDRGSWFDLYGTKTISNINVEFINTKNRLREEGRIMNHCVGAYYESCILGHSFIFSMNDGSNRSTLELRYQLGNNRTPSSLIINQHRSYRNTDPISSHESVAKLVLRTMEDKFMDKELIKSNPKDVLKSLTSNYITGIELNTRLTPDICEEVLAKIPGLVYK
jgi:hypothetical protein